MTAKVKELVKNFNDSPVLIKLIPIILTAQAIVLIIASVK